MEPMSPTPAPPPAAPPTPATSLPGRLMNVVAAPGEVFAGIKATPPSVANWLVPVLIFAVIGMISVCIMFAQPAIQQTVRDQQVKALDKQVQQGKITQAQEDQALQVMEKFMGPTMLAIFGSISIVIYGSPRFSAGPWCCGWRGDGCSKPNLTTGRPWRLPGCPPSFPPSAW